LGLTGPDTGEGKKHGKRGVGENKTVGGTNLDLGKKKSTTENWGPRGSHFRTKKTNIKRKRQTCRALGLKEKKQVPSLSEVP